MIDLELFRTAIFMGKMVSHLFGQKKVLIMAFKIPVVHFSINSL